MTSIKHLQSGEIIHNPVGPWIESRNLYANQSGLERRLREKKSEPLVLYDVGLGAGFNASAALEVYFKVKSELKECRPLHILSFENDLTLFDFALENLENFPESLPLQAILMQFQKNQDVKENGLQWSFYGDFLEAIQKSLPKADLVFFDPYSPKINPIMWSFETFENLRPLMRDGESCLLTYSTSTVVRTTMLLANFCVGHGRSSGLKLETTTASPSRSSLENPLGERWLLRWERSHTPLPLGNIKISRDEVFTRLKNHPQFLP